MSHHEPKLYLGNGPTSQSGLERGFEGLLAADPLPTGLSLSLSLASTTQTHHNAAPIHNLHVPKTFHLFDIPQSVCV